MRSSIIKQLLIKILLFLFLVSSTLSAVHIHHDDDHEEGCEVCVVINNFQSGDIPDSTVEIASLECSFDEIVQYESNVSKHLPLGYHSTAPPSF